MTLDDFLTLPLPKRILWLHSDSGPRGAISHDKLAAELGTTRQTVIGWEGGREPNRYYADRLAEFSGFPAWTFRRRESEEAVAEMFARRLGALEAEMPLLRGLVLEGFELLGLQVDADGRQASLARGRARRQRQVEGAR